MNRSLLGIASLLFSIGIACTTTQGARPGDMSISGHAHAAEAAEQEATQHIAQYDPDGTHITMNCRAARTDSGPTPCWSEEINPTSEHHNVAERLRKAAADHRAASTALRDAEAAACSGISDADRDASPLLRTGDVIGVEDVRKQGTKSGPASRLVGAAISIRAVPGLTKEYLQRLSNCHISRNSSMGYSMPEMARCPFAVKGASASVVSGDGTFVVQVTSDDETTANEISKRARALVQVRTH